MQLSTRRAMRVRIQLDRHHILVNFDLPSPLRARFHWPSLGDRPDPSSYKNPSPTALMRSLQRLQSSLTSLTSARCSSLPPTPLPTTSSLLLLPPRPHIPRRSSLSRKSPTSVSGSPVATSSTASPSQTSASSRPAVPLQLAVPGSRVGAASNPRGSSEWPLPSRPEAPPLRSS